MDADTVACVRRFNRTVTERVGALDESYLGRGRPLGETRLLWEIGTDGADVRDLRRRLGLDAGYASRLLRSLESERLVVVEHGSRDRRVRRARLTEDGRAERAELDRLSDGLATSMLEPLERSQRARLIAAMDDVERLMRASLVTITVADPGDADARWCIEQYFTELGDRFEDGFDPAISIAPPIDELKPPTGLLLVARLRQQPVGCGALKFRPGRLVPRRHVPAEPRVALGQPRQLVADRHQLIDSPRLAQLREEV